MPRERQRRVHQRPRPSSPPAALAHLDALLPLADDPDAGVRRELILAFRNLPTDKVGEALKKLAASWDGQDRWYLEALGLALETASRPSSPELFDGTLYGDLDLPEIAARPRQRRPAAVLPGRSQRGVPLGSATRATCPPIAWQDARPGLAVHRAEVLPLADPDPARAGRPELQQAADDVLMQIGTPAGAVALADLARLKDPIRKRQILASLGRKLDGDRTNAKNRPEVVRAIESALADPDLRTQGIQTAAATEDPRIARSSCVLADAKRPEDARIAAVEDRLARVRQDVRLLALSATLSSNSERRGAVAPARECAAISRAYVLRRFGLLRARTPPTRGTTATAPSVTCEQSVTLMRPPITAL